MHSHACAQAEQIGPAVPHLAKGDGAEQDCGHVTGGGHVGNKTRTCRAREYSRWAAPSSAQHGSLLLLQRRLPSAEAAQAGSQRPAILRGPPAWAAPGGAPLSGGAVQAGLQERRQLGQCGPAAPQRLPSLKAEPLQLLQSQDASAGWATDVIHCHLPALLDAETQKLRQAPVAADQTQRSTHTGPCPAE